MTLLGIPFLKNWNSEQLTTIQVAGGREVVEEKILNVSYNKKTE